jgi:hypothetical protein
LAQGGEDLSTNMLGQVVDQVKDLTPETIRIDHIYNGYNVVSRDNSGQLVFNWQRLDEIVNSITAVGAIPMLVLSYMPPAISRGDILDLPRDWRDWSFVVQKTIEHYSGELAIVDMTYEVWNEPDLFGNWKTYGDKNYLELYRYASIGASLAQGVKPFKIGGPAITVPYFAWFNAFLNFVSQERLRIDFLSWHRYIVIPQKYSEDINLMNRIVESHRQSIGNIDWYITETGPDSENNPGYDTDFAAAHLIAVIRETIDRVKRVYTFEIVDGKDPDGKIYWGRWGILTNPVSGVNKKARYRAIQLLNRLHGFQLPVSGEGTWVKAIAAIGSDNTIQILLVNYDRYQRHQETVPVSIGALVPSSPYSLSQTFLDGSTRGETVFTDAGGSIQTELLLAPNAIILVEISPPARP